MQKFILLLLCASTLVASCYAQSDYQAGYVVDLKGDTLRGLIKYERWDRNPRQISFKSASASSSTNYDPLTIKSFWVAGEIYEGGIVDVDQSPSKIRDIDESPLPAHVKDSVFLQSLVGGNKSLLFLKDQSGKIHFFIKEEGVYLPLIYKQYTRRTDTSSKAIAENNAYKGSLALYLKDCPDTQKRLKNTTYTQSALTELFKHFYECTRADMQYTNQRADGKWEAGVIVGMSMTKLGFRGPTKYLTDIEYDASTKPVFGIFFDVKLLRTKGWRISNDILYTSFDVKGQGEFEDFPDYTAYSSFTYSYVKSHHALQVSLLGRGKLYVAAGFSAGVAIQKESEIVISYETGTTVPRKFESRNYEFGYLAGLGLRSGKWNAEVRFEQTTGISNHLSEGSNVMRGNFFVRYRVFSQ